MHPIAGLGFGIVVIFMVILIVLKILRDGHDSGLESAFESNRQRARIMIAVYQKWMAVVFVPIVVGMLMLVGGALYTLYTGQGVVCR